MNVTLITLTQEQLNAFALNAAKLAVAQVAKHSGELWDKKQVAEHYGVNPKTIDNWTRSGKIQAPTNNRWKRWEILGNELANRN